MSALTDLVKSKLWKKYSVTLGIEQRIVGGVPVNPAIIAGWVASTMKHVSEAERERVVNATISELPEITDEAVKQRGTSFKKDATGIYLEGRAIKAMFKEASNITRDLLVSAESELAKQRGTKEKADGKSKYTNLRSKVAEQVFVDEFKVYLCRDGKPLDKADGSEERAIHVITAQGPRTSIKIFEYVDAPCELTFTLSVLSKGVVSVDEIDIFLTYAGRNGLGADRSQGMGTFKVLKLEPIEGPDTAPKPSTP